MKQDSAHSLRSAKRSRELREAISYNSMLNLDPNSANAAIVSPEVAFNSRFLNSPRIADLFLLNSKQSSHRIYLGKSLFHDFENTVSSGTRFRESGERLALPEPWEVPRRLDDVIRLRRSTDKFSGAKVSVGMAGSILYYASGITGHALSRRAKLAVGKNVKLVAHPSAGRLLSIAPYVISLRIKGLPSAVYEYDRNRHALVKIAVHKRSDLFRPFRDSEFSHQRLGKAAFLVVLVAHALMVTRNYGDRGLRYLLIEAGELAQNLHLATFALGGASIDVGKYYDKELEDLVGIDGVATLAIHVLLVGLRK